MTAGGAAGARVLIVEDEALIALAIEDDLLALGYEVVGVAASAARAVALAAETAPDLVLMDVRLQGAEDGVDAALRIRAVGAAPAVIFVTASREPETLARMTAARPAAVLSKPVSGRAIDAAIRRALDGAARI